MYGLLPPTGDSSGVHYSYSRHRPITGQEEFLLRGFPIGRLDMRTEQYADLDLVQLAATRASALAASTNNCYAPEKQAKAIQRRGGNGWH